MEYTKRAPIIRSKRGKLLSFVILNGFVGTVGLGFAVQALLERRSDPANVVLVTAGMLMFMAIAVGYSSLEITIFSESVEDRWFALGPRRVVTFADVWSIDIPEVTGTLWPGVHNLRLKTRHKTYVLATGMFSNRRQLIRLIIERARVENPAVVIDPLLLVQR